MDMFFNVNLQLQTAGDVTGVPDIEIVCVSGTFDEDGSIKYEGMNDTDDVGSVVKSFKIHMQ